METDFTDSDQYITDGDQYLLMVTDIYPMVTEESSVPKPQKVAKIDENELQHLRNLLDREWTLQKCQG